MLIEKDISLKKMTTMKVGGNARFFVSAQIEDDLVAALHFARREGIPFFVLGGGSNIVVSDEGFYGIVIKNELLGKSFHDDGDETRITVAAGENWDDFVRESTERGLSGIENLSFIPGTVGAAPVQNIGAYGVDFKDVLESVRVYDAKTETFRDVAHEECRFSYRHSIFKEHKHLVIVAVTLRLKKSRALNLSYQDVRRAVFERGLDETRLTPRDVREIVVSMRKQKLPDWHTTPTAGSFFKNPEIYVHDYEKLKETYPECPGFLASDGRIKIPLGWLIERLGLKGERVGGVSVFQKHALVIVNDQNGTASDVKVLSERIAHAVERATGIVIEPEVQFVGHFS
jgi:UDP-N-acetylmuramate dehydrogenase